MNILIVEDELQLSKEITKHLMDNNFVCYAANNYNEATQIIDEVELEVVLLDLKLPDNNGINLIDYLKTKNQKSGIIVLSANNEIDTRVKALEAGADDFIVKPFHLTELNARVKALIRRKNYKGENILVYKEISVNIPKFEVKINNEIAPITNKEFELLLYFIANAGKVISKEAISYNVWQNHADLDVSNEIIYTHIKNLRKKLIAAGCSDYIQSVYGVGYKFDV